MAYTTLTFHPRCGKSVRVTEGGTKVEKTISYSSHKYCSALTARPLRTEEVFTLQLSGHHSIMFGVTTHSPGTMKFPQYMYGLQGTWCLQCGREGWIFVNGGVVNMEYLSRATLGALVKGGTLGLVVMKHRELSFFVNGKSVGVAAIDIPNKVYGFVDLLDNTTYQAVNMIPENAAAPTRALSQATPAQKKEKEEKIEKKHSQLKLTVREIAYSELEFGETLGVGGQGAVYRGQWKSSSTKTGSLSVAIKRVVGKIRDEEAKILCNLQHPNVITFYGICTDRHPEYFIITEVAEGGSLYNLIHEKHYHPQLEESIRWAEEVAEGMRYLHQRNVIHRDLKSQNVLLTAGRTIKICDFGSAKEFDHTTIQTSTGTYRWIAPEVLKRTKVSLSCDVFSYGMVLFEIFKHEVPFAGIHTIKVANMILEGKTPAIPASLKPYLANLMKRCWQMNPKVRPSFGDILAILEKKVDQPILFPSRKECPEPVGGKPEATQDTTDGRPAGESSEKTNKAVLRSHTCTFVLRDDKPLTPKDLPQLQTVLDEASGMWYPLGMKLKLDAKTLTGIATASANDNSTALSLMLTCWLKSKDQPPLLPSLTVALNSPDIGLTHLSDTLLKDKNQFVQ